ncbi:transcriptional repressor [Candidatus Woesearchaeota archaeon]|nr:transcriptional repressor [Candidatus Woesearchaeota archaeon]
MKTRTTTQQVHILQYLRQKHSHPCAEAIHKEVVKQLPTITLATVYRNLNKLVEQEDIISFKVGNTYHYDGKVGDHIHGICENTGKIVDIEQPELVQYVRKKIHHHGFTPKNIRIIVTGTCKRGETQ